MKVAIRMGYPMFCETSLQEIFGARLVHFKTLGLPSGGMVNGIRQFLSSPASHSLSPRAGRGDEDASLRAERSNPALNASRPGLLRPFASRNDAFPLLSWPDLFRPSRFKWQSRATTIEIAGSSPAMTRFIVLAVRSAPGSSSRDGNFSTLRTDLRQRTPAVVTGTSRSLLRATNESVRKRKAERRRTLILIRRNLSVTARALQGALARGRSTTALCQWEYFIPRLNLGQAS
jgi:hypothetical protein